MKCPSCGYGLRKTDLFCPRCGQTILRAMPMRPKTVPDALLKQANHLETPRRSGWALSLTVVFVAILMVAAIAGLGVAGIYYGLQDRAQVERQAAEEHYQKGLEHLSQGELEIAIAEFELVIRLNPQHEHVSEKLSEARRRLAARPSATPISHVDTKAVYLSELRMAYKQGNWPQVLDLAERLLAADPAYHREEIGQALFDAFYGSAAAMVQEGRLEEAIRFFDRALALQPGNAQVARERQLAALYMAAIGYWNADWAKAIENLSAAYRLSPGYKDVRQRLHEAYVSYGDQLAQKQEWCGAEQQYARAIELAPSQSVNAKRQDSLKRCSGATPAPSGPAKSSVPSGTYVGRVTEFIDIDSNRILIRGRVLNKEAIGIGGVRVQIQAYTFSAVSVTDGVGQFSFDGLNNAVTYTLSLLDRQSLAVDAPGIWGKLTWVNFEETK